MALNAFVKLTIGGGSLVEGILGQDRTVDTMGGVDVTDRLEVLFFRGATEIAARGGQGARSVGHRRHGEAIFVIRLGSSAPRLAQALAQNAAIDAELALFGLNRNTGSPEHQFTYRISGGRLVRLELQQPANLGPQTPTMPPMVRFGVVPHSVTWVSETHSLAFEDAPRSR